LPGSRRICRELVFRPHPLPSSDSFAQNPFKIALHSANCHFTVRVVPEFTTILLTEHYKTLKDNPANSKYGEDSLQQHTLPFSFIIYRFSQ